MNLTNILPAPTVSAPRRAALRAERSVVTVLLLAGFFLTWAGQILDWRLAAVRFSTETGSYEIIAGGSALTNWLRVIGSVCFVGSGMAALLGGRSRNTGIVLKVASILTLAVAAYWYLVTYTSLQAAKLALLEPTSPVILLSIFGVFIGDSEEVWPLVDKLAVMVAFGSALYGIYMVIQLPFSGRQSGGGPLILNLVTGFWPAAYILLRLPAGNLIRQLTYSLPLLACAYISVFTYTRSWALQCLLVFAIRFGLLNRSPEGKQSRGHIYLGVGLGLTLLVGFLYYLGRSESSGLAGLVDRLDEDTRTEQYRAFFEQVSFTDLLQGCGPYSSYALDETYGSNYQFIDNQVLFISYKFGALALLSYFLAILLPGFRLARQAVQPEMRSLGLIIVLWFIALLGVSIYNNIGLTLANFFIALFAGRCLKFLAMPTRLASAPRPAKI